MNVLLIGSGGREHAIAWKIAQSNLLEKLYISPGNAGTSEVGSNIDLNLKSLSDIKDFIKSNNIEMVIVGPEAPLVDGIHDQFLIDEFLKDIPVIGPVKAGAMLEGSKDFANRFMEKYGIPTAGFKTFIWDIFFFQTFNGWFDNPFLYFCHKRNISKRNW